jgi:hypothetical protein
MEYRPASRAALDRTHISACFDLSAPPRVDPVIGTGEMGLEICFHWHGRWRSELHRWPITRRASEQLIQWRVGDEILPPRYSDQSNESE